MNIYNSICILYIPSYYSTTTTLLTVYTVTYYVSIRVTCVALYTVYLYVSLLVQSVIPWLVYVLIELDPCSARVLPSHPINNK